jgi:predicted MFS family arabinose efflux permease
MATDTKIKEGRLLFLIGAVQFVNILDFMMVMPLGPDFARALDMPSSALGLVGGSYTAAAAVSGVLGALFLDRFDRRKALACALAGLVIGTAAGGFAVDLPTLLAARVAAGVFGGPATAISLAIISDVVPVERRGRAMGAVMGAFSVASVLGVPAGLELARVGGWQLPFFAVAALGAVIALLAMFSMPPLTGHLRPGDSIAPPAAAHGLLGFLGNKTIMLSLASTALATVSTFALVPNLSAYLQFNLGYPREHLGLLYLAGGTVSFATMRVAGKLSDRVGPAVTAAIGNWLFAAILYLIFIEPTHALPVLMLFTGFMVTSSFRMVPMQALSTRVPNGRERARFMSAQSAVQHLASAVGAMLSAKLLGSSASGALIGIERVAWFSIALTAALPLVIYRVQLRVDRPLTQTA